jgi:glycosyltransferase involved in cell wall biosynthesis
MITSVVIPSRNAVDRLLYTLYSLNLQYTPFEDFEVIVVDNASTDGTSERVNAFTAHYPLRFHRCRNRLSRSQLLNIGVKKARGDVVILLGSHLIVPREFIGTHRQAHQQENNLVLLGMGQRRIYSVYDPRFSRAQRNECESWLAHYPQIKRPHTWRKVVPLLEEKQISNGLSFHIGLSCPEADRCRAYVENGGAVWSLFQTDHVSLPRRAFDKVGLFKARLRREMEQDMARRLVKAGYRFQVADKLTLLKQEQPPLATSGVRRKKKNHRMR